STATAVPTSTATSAPTNTPTARPTNTPTPKATNTALPTATSTQAPTQRSYTTGASVSPSTVMRGANVSVTALVKSATASSALIDVEVYDAAGTKVFQQAWDNQAFGADQTRTYRSNWSVASTATSGSYTVKIGIFGTGWFAFYAWNDRATAFTVI